MYVTGGLAYTQANFVGRSPGGTLSFVGKIKKYGTVVGLGAEFKYDPRWSWRVEGLYYIFNKSAAGGLGSSRAWEFKVKDALVVRLGANIHFDGTGWGR
jgi:opacity protein-like surface antigen